MESSPLTGTSALAIAAVAGPSLYPEPEWITRAADELGYTWARLAWQRAACVPGAWFDQSENICSQRVFRILTLDEQF
jgi:hypothetical protein